jgi:hypothetical protein
VPDRKKADPRSVASGRGVAPNWELIHHDTFTDANGTALSAHTPEIQAGVYFGSGVEIQSNATEHPPPAGNNVVFFPTGVEDGLMQVEADFYHTAEWGWDNIFLSNWPTANRSLYWDMRYSAGARQIRLYENNGAGNVNITGYKTGVYPIDEWFTVKVEHTPDRLFSLWVNGDLIHRARTSFSDINELGQYITYGPWGPITGPMRVDNLKVWGVK